MDVGQDLGHAHSAVPLAATTHLACGGQLLSAQENSGLSTEERNGKDRKRIREKER